MQQTFIAISIQRCRILIVLTTCSFRIDLDFGPAPSVGPWRAEGSDWKSRSSVPAGGCECPRGGSGATWHAPGCRSICFAQVFPNAIPAEFTACRLDGRQDALLVHDGAVTFVDRIIRPHAAGRHIDGGQIRARVKSAHVAILRHKPQ